MSFISQIAEARIKEAVERGELDNLPGAGKPLVLHDDALVPEELRVAYRALKNAGYLPREIGVRREIADLQALIAGTDDKRIRGRGYKRLNYLMAQLQSLRGATTDLRVEQAYYQQLLDRLNK